MYFQDPSPVGIFPGVRPGRACRRWGRILSCGVVLLLFSGCDRGDREVVVTGQRDLVLWDRAYPGNIKDSAPEEWRRVPWTQMRYYNYRFGAKEDGEVWLSVIPRQGDDAVLQNVNRWYNQFRMPEITELDELKQEPMLDVTGYVVEAEGVYHAGMGAEPREDSKMLAVAIPYSTIIVTVKMVGSPAEVEAQRDNFLGYCQSLDFFNVAPAKEEDRVQKPEKE